MTTSPRLLLPFLLLITSLYASAQSYVTNMGLTPNSTYLPVDHGFIDLSNGNLHLEIPLTSSPQRSRSILYSARMVYDSRIWHVAGQTWQPTNVTNSNGGWRLQTGGTVGTVVWTNTFGSNKCGRPYVEHSNFIWNDPTGASHSFPGVITVQYTSSSSSCSPGSPGNADATGKASDGSGYTLAVSNFTNAIVFAADGTAYRIPIGLVPTAGTPLVVDTNGNYTTVDGNGNVVDTKGVVPVSLTANGNINTYNVRGVGGTSQSYTQNLETVFFKTNFSQSGIGEASGYFSAMESLQLPDGSSYSFTYDAGTDPGHYGELTSMKLPSGGTISFGWSTFTDSYGNANQWISSVTKDGGTTTLRPQKSSTCSGGCSQYQTVTFPSGEVNSYGFTLDASGTLGGGITSAGAGFYASSVYGTPETRSTTQQYTYAPQSFAYLIDSNLSFIVRWQMPTSVFTTTNFDEVGIWSAVSNDIGPTPGDVKAYDFRASIAGAPNQIIDETVMSYAGTKLTTPSGNLVTVGSFPSDVKMTDSAGNMISHTSYGYDEGSVTTTSGLPERTSSGLSARGNRTSTHRVGSSDCVCASDFHCTTNSFGVL